MINNRHPPGIGSTYDRYCFIYFPFRCVSLQSDIVETINFWHYWFHQAYFKTAFSNNQDYLFLYQIVCINFETLCIFRKNSVRANHWLIRKPLQKPHSFHRILAPTHPAPIFINYFILRYLLTYICAFGFFLVFLFFILTGHWITKSDADWKSARKPEKTARQDDKQLGVIWTCVQQFIFFQ